MDECSPNSKSKNIVLFHHLKDTYGPMAQSIIDTGIEVGSFKHDLTGYDKAVLFCNDPSVVSDMHNGHIKIGWWMCDLRPADMLQTIDVEAVFLCNSEYLEDYSKKYNAPAYHVPQCGIDSYFPCEDKIDWNVLFIGNFSTTWHKNRHEIIDHIVGPSNALKLKIIIGDFYTRNQKYLYKNTPINLAISPQAKGYTSNRLFNILSSGGFCLTLWYPEIEKQFVNKKHLVWFKTKEEAVELINYYLAHPEEREKIAKQGNELYLKKHTAKKRLDEMFALLDKK